MIINVSVFNFSKAKDNLIGVGDVGDYFFTKLWNYCGFGGWERAGGGGVTTAGVGLRGIEIGIGF